ncbi:hypothetical protein ARAM_002939, partial [Aspergillus rambellii]
ATRHSSGQRPCVDDGTQESCVSDIISLKDNCTSAILDACTSDYHDMTSCYMNGCGLVEYLYVMNITNTVCNVPPRSRQSTQIIVGSIFIPLTSIAIVLRLMGRSPFSEAFGTDDFLALIAFVSRGSSMGDTAVMLIGAKNGWGVDMWALSQSEIIQLMKATVATKLAVLFFYLRIFTTEWFKRQAYAMIALCTAYGLAVMFQSAFDCSPPSYYWNRFGETAKGTCVSYVAYRAMPPINVGFDVMVLLLPLPSILRLNLPCVKKIRVTAMFCVGIFIIIAGVLRLTHLYGSITTYNVTYNGGELSYYGVIEADVGVICTCMPPIAVLLKRLFPRWSGSSVDRGYEPFQGSSTPKNQTLRSSLTNSSMGSPTKPQSGSEDNIRLIHLSTEDPHLQKPDKCFSYS